MSIRKSDARTAVSRGKGNNGNASDSFGFISLVNFVNTTDVIFNVNELSICDFILVNGHHSFWRLREIR